MENKYYKMLQVLDVDLQNLNHLTGDWLKGVRKDMREEALIAHYMTLTSEEIDRIHAEYYGTEEAKTSVNWDAVREELAKQELVMLVIGEINFPHPQATDEYWDKVFVERVDKILFVPSDEVGKVGEEHLANGYDAYMAPSLTDAEICSNSHWYLFDDIQDSPVVIDPQMRVAVGFDSIDEMKLDYPNIKPVGDIDGEKFCWIKYDVSVDCVGGGVLKKNPMDAHQRALKAVDLAEEIVENNQLYQNLYRCEEAYGCLKHDEELWKMTMYKVMTIIQDQVEPHNKGDK
jgi:hypothetical protein